MIRAAEPFEFDSPKNWRAERIAFPLGFAPELKHSGFEELRFAPGMFNPKSNTYWTYVFFWWIEGEVTIDRTQMERDLKNYYLGLSKTVGRSRKLVIDPEKISAQLKPFLRFHRSQSPHRHGPRCGRFGTRSKSENRDLKPLVAAQANHYALAP
jgi:hypothetical protein